MRNTPNLDRYLDPEQHERATTAKQGWVWCRDCGIGDAEANQSACRNGVCRSTNLQRIPRARAVGAR